MASLDFNDPLEETPPAAGHNNPPSAIDDAREAFKDLGAFLARVPAITDEAGASEAKLYSDRTSAALKSLEKARDDESSPLYTAWKAAIAKYKPTQDSLQKLADQLAARLTVYAKAEKAKRDAIAAEAARVAAEKERLAREAEAAEREAIENAKVGEFTDVAAATEKADEAFADFQRESRFAARAKKETKVRIGGGFDKALSLRTTKTLVVEDAAKALAAIGATEKIKEAILSSAREWRKAHGGELPAGIIEVEDMKI